MREVETPVRILMEIKDYVPPSSGLPSSVTRFSPSIVVDTLFPRNLDLGRSSPIMLTWLAGVM